MPQFFVSNPLLSRKQMVLGSSTGMDSWANYRRRPTGHAEQLLYDHWLNRVQLEAPEEIIDRFRTLFIDGLDYPDKPIRRALVSIINSGYAERQFKFILNRSCYIPINRWLMQPSLRDYVPQLVSLFETTPRGIAHTRTNRYLRELVQQFATTEQYAALRRLRQIIEDTADEKAAYEASTLGRLIRRYPYLYEYSLLTVDSTDSHKQNVRLMQESAQKQLETDLSQYLVYRNLRSRREDVGGVLLGADEARWQRSLKNPTLLSDRQLDDALQHFSGKFDGAHTYRDYATQFLTYTRETRSYSAFKQELYAYLTDSLDASCGVQRISSRLNDFLKSLYSEWDEQRLHDSLMVNTCQKMLNFLVVEGPRSLEHANFLELLVHLGNTLTIGLLLKIVLLCRKVKPWLERRFAILFNHYEAHACNDVTWLVESLEHLNIAFCTNFGDVKPMLVY